MDGRAAYIAVDWGTTNRRAFAVSGSGAVLDSLQDGRGILSLAPGDYPAEIADLRARLGPHPVIAVGMVGSNRGWLSAPYIAAPATLAALAKACVEPAPDVRIVPGVALRDGQRPDVMRGKRSRSSVRSKRVQRRRRPCSVSRAHTTSGSRPSMVRSRISPP